MINLLFKNMVFQADLKHIRAYVLRPRMGYLIALSIIFIVLFLLKYSSMGLSTSFQWVNRPTIITYLNDQNTTDVLINNMEQAHRMMLKRRWKNCSFKPSEITKLLLNAADTRTTDTLTSHSQWPTWIRDLCPKVMDHFSNFTYFPSFIERVPMMTTLYAAHSVCSMYVANQLAKAIGTELLLYAGSHLGALLHAGPIPWDDDVDMFLDSDYQSAFLEQCRQMRMFHPDAKLQCHVHFNAIKLSVITSDSFDTSARWKSPFVDIFLYRSDRNKSKIFETTPYGEDQRFFDFQGFFPTRRYYFGGLNLMGPNETIALERYDVNRCVVGDYNHRLEEMSSLSKIPRQLDCCHLAQRFPFTYRAVDVNRTWVFGGSHVMVLPLIE